MLKRKYILPVLGVIFILIQFFRIDKTNPPIDVKLDLVSMVNPPTEIGQKIVNACYACHSYDTSYPWYTNVAPVSWWLKGHINGGREHLNFSTWGDYDIEKKKDKLEKCVEMLEKKWMPMGIYTLMHAEAKLTEKERAEMILYFKGLQ